jgi:hypothetical protein
MSRQRVDIVALMADDVMPDEREDPSATTEAFRAFAQLAEPEPERRPVAVIATLAVIVVLIAILALILMR